MEKKDGGPAFPTDHFVVEEHPEKDCTRRVFLPGSGMTLRDYFAAAALGGYCANSNPDLIVESIEKNGIDCYKMADAMIAAMDK